MAKARVNTFAWRLRRVVEDELGMKQSEMYDRLLGVMKRDDPSFTMTRGAFNKLFTGDTTTPKHNIMKALREITGRSLDYLITGEEAEVEKAETYYGEDAHRVAEMVDAMLPRSRHLMLVMSSSLLAIDEEQNESDARLAELLQDNISAMANGHRAQARDYIDRTDADRRRLRQYKR